MNTLVHTDLNLIWDEIDITEKYTENKTWKQEYMEIVVKDLIELKIKAEKENKPIFYNQLRLSLIRAHKVQNEILDNIKNIN